jgi:hypothetical protein
MLFTQCTWRNLWKYTGLLGITILTGIESCTKLNFALLFSPLPAPYFIVVTEKLADGRHACANKS